jgi:acyl carrier protein
MNDIRECVRRFIIEHFLFGQAGGLQDHVSFLEQGIIDSTGVLELVAFLEQTFGIKVDAEETIPDNLDSVDAICAFVQAKQQATATS